MIQSSFGMYKDSTNQDFIAVNQYDELQANSKYKLTQTNTNRVTALDFVSVLEAKIISEVLCMI